MTVESMDCGVRYATDGMQKAFPVAYSFLEASDLGVYFAQTSHDDVKLELNKDYTVAGGDNGSFEHGGTVLFTTAPAAGRLAILREMPYTQESNYTPNGDIPAETLEANFDKATMLIQQLKEELGRCIKVGIASGMKPQDLFNMMLQTKDMCLDAATSASASAATASAAQLSISRIWLELTGDPSMHDAALLTAQEAFQATGAVQAAAEAGKASVNEASLAAVNYARGQVEEAKNSSLDTLTATTKTATEEALLKVNEAIGAGGTLDAAVTATEEAKNASSAIKAEMQQSIEAANQTFNQKLTEAHLAKTDAAGSANNAGASALTAAQAKADALTAKALAESAKAAAEAAAGNAESAVNTSLTAHNANPSAHANMTHYASSTAHSSLFAKYLPLAGGTMTGPISRNGMAITNPLPGGFLSFQSGCHGSCHGGGLWLYDDESTLTPGSFLLRASSNDGYKDLIGKPDGSLMWAGKALIRNDITNPTEIRANADLNSYTSLGFYYCPTIVTAKTVLNCPVKTAFGLKVIRTSNQHQILYEYNTNNIWSRWLYESTFGPWEKVAGVGNIGAPDYNKAVTLANATYCPPSSTYTGSAIPTATAGWIFFRAHRTGQDGSGTLRLLVDGTDLIVANPQWYNDSSQPSGFYPAGKGSVVKMRCEGLTFLELRWIPEKS